MSLRSIYNEATFRFCLILEMYATLNFNAGDKVKCRKKLERVVVLLKKITPTLSPQKNHDAQLFLGRTLSTLASISELSNNDVEARAYAEKAFAIKAKYAITDVSQEIEALKIKANTLRSDSQSQEAFLLLTEARNLSETKYGKTNAKTITILVLMAGTLSELNRLEECEALDRYILSIRQEICAPYDPDLAVSYLSLGLTLVKKKDDEAAEEFLKKSLAIFEAPPPSIIEILKRRDLKQLAAPNPGMEHPLAITLCYSLANNQNALKKFEVAEKFYRQTVKLSKAQKEIDLQDVKRNLKRLSNFLKTQNREEESAEVDQEISSY